MDAKLEKVWAQKFEDRHELRLDWSNDRHHAVTIRPPHGPEQVADAFQEMAMLIIKDPHLRNGYQDDRAR